MKFILLIIVTFGISTHAFCQTPKKTDTTNTLKDTVYEAVDQMPSFPGGDSAMYLFIDKVMKYPDVAAEKSLHGELWIEFIVGKDGKALNPIIIQGSIGEGCEEEAIRIILSMPNWIPAKIKGNNVAAKKRIQILFSAFPENYLIYSIEQREKKNNKFVAYFDDRIPYFKGGEKGLIQYLRENCHYPDSAIINSLQGKLYVKFEINKDGYSENIRIIKGQIGGGCEEEAIRLIKNMPKWKTYKTNIQSKNSEYTIPIVFNLTEDEDTNIYNSVDQMPSFPGGDSAMYKFLLSNLKIPETTENIRGDYKFIFEFIVNKDGAIQDVKKIKGECPLSFDDETIRVIKLMPDWIPGKINGELVNVRYRLPINFKL